MPEFKRLVAAGACVRRDPRDPREWGANAREETAWLAPPPADALNRVMRANLRYLQSLLLIPIHAYHGKDGYTMRWSLAKLNAQASHNGRPTAARLNKLS